MRVKDNHTDAAIRLNSKMPEHKRAVVRMVVRYQEGDFLLILHENGLRSGGKYPGMYENQKEQQEDLRRLHPENAPGAPFNGHSRLVRKTFRL
jgi:hypothetical protein